MSYYNGSAYTFTWTGRQLTDAVKGSTNMSFTYNDDGIRTSKTVNGVKHTYQLNGSQIVSEQWGDKFVVYLYDSAGMPIGMMYRTTSYAEDQWDVFWYEKNLQGDIVAIYNESGTEVVTYTYIDAWGNHTVSYFNNGASTGAIYNPFRYRGYYYDTDLEMYYLQSRYYDAKICRFINADGYVSTGQGLTGNNMFAYCGNNPVNYVDYSGEFALPFAIPVEYIVLLGLLAVGMTVLIADATGEQVLGNFFSDVITRTFDAVNDLVDKIKSLSDSKAYANETNNNDIFASYTVYGLMNPETNMIEYVGRTKSVIDRKIAHGNSDTRGHLEFVILKDNLTRAQARGLEQYYMLVYHTINASNPVNNQINGISLKNPKLNIYSKAVFDYFENQISNDFLNWLGV